MALETQVYDALEKAESLGAEALTQDGRPRTEWLEAELGIQNITAADRDAWWADYLAAREAETLPAEAEGEEDQTTAEAAPVPTGPSLNPPAGPVMWVGPTILRPVHLGRNTIFRAGVLPVQVREMVQDHPELATLIVPIKEYPLARLALKDKKTDLAKVYGKAVKLASEK